MLSNPVRAAVVGTLLTAGIIGGTAGTATAETHPSAPAGSVRTTAGEPIACATVGALQSALQKLSTTTNPQLVNRVLGQVVALLQQQPSLTPPDLIPTYQWLVAKLQILRGLVAIVPSPQLIGIVNGLAADLADALDSVPCVGAAG